MKICLTIEHFDSSRGGAEQWTADFAASLLARGHEVHVAAKSFSAEDCRRLAIIPHPSDAHSSRVALGHNIAQIVDEIQADIIHDMGLAGIAISSTHIMA